MRMYRGVIQENIFPSSAITFTLQNFSNFNSPAALAASSLVASVGNRDQWKNNGSAWLSYIPIICMEFPELWAVQSHYFFEDLRRPCGPQNKCEPCTFIWLVHCYHGINFVLLQMLACMLFRSTSAEEGLGNIRAFLTFSLSNQASLFNDICL